jgi:uncharacterized membrane protein YvbJ
MIHYIYIFSIIIITIFVLIYYFIKKNEHEEQLRKIDLLELIEKKKKDDLEKLRKYTEKCPYGNFDNPRECYLGSDNRCSWNIKTHRCELI